MLTALRNAAAPALRAWIDAHDHDVRVAIARANLRAERMQGQIIDIGVKPPEQPLAFGNLTEATADDGLADAERRTALAWLRRRATGLRGTFDAQEAHDALRALPGWSSTVVPGSLAVSTDPLDPYEYTDKDRTFLMPEAVARTYTVLPRGQRPKDMPPGNYAERVEPIGAIVEPVSRAYSYRSGWYDAPPGTVGYKSDLPGSDEVFALPFGFRDHVGSPLYRLVKPTTVTADPKRAALRVTDPSGSTATVEGNKAWDALYAGGLERDAAERVEEIARRVKTREQMAKQEWGKHLCPVCFGYAAVTPSSNHMVDHGHERPGWGYNVSPCEGNRFAPYKDSPAGTRERLAQLEREYTRKIADLRSLIQHPEKHAHDVKVDVRDAQGRVVYDIDPAYPKGDARHKRARTDVIKVRIGHPLFEQVHAEWIKSTRATVQNIRASIPFYRAALRAWHAGLDTREPIMREVRSDDTPPMPPDLA